MLAHCCRRERGRSTSRANATSIPEAPPRERWSQARPPAATSQQAKAKPLRSPEPRTMTPIVPWPGGKRRLAKHILPLIEKSPHRCYVEPFAGGAAILFLRKPAPVEIINDLNGELVRLYRCVRHHLDELVRQFRWALVSREMYRWA